jgi:hypothetical protein
MLVALDDQGGCGGHADEAREDVQDRDLAVLDERRVRVDGRGGGLSLDGAAPWLAPGCRPSWRELCGSGLPVEPDAVHAEDCAHLQQHDAEQHESLLLCVLPGAAEESPADGGFLGRQGPKHGSV